jgi:galactokinase
MKQEIAKTFRERYGNEPQLFFAPGRINLIGEHVDYNDGYVMPAAIDKGIWFAVAPNNSSAINCYSYDMKEAVSVSYDDVQPQEGWKNYILGVIHVMLENKLPINGMDCVFGGNLPVGAGLSSSAAVECGLAFALNDIFRLGQSRKDLALMAQRAEHLYPGVKCGIMDQYASLMGKEDNIIMLDCSSVEHQYIPFNLQEHTLVLINTKVQHSLVSGEYNIRRKQCGEGLRLLRSKDNAIVSFRDVSPDHLETYRNEMDEVIYRRCSYVVSEIERTRQASDYLTNDQVKEFGRLMYETHEGLSKYYDVSCDELDFLVDKAKKNDVTGSRVMGGGFGGCTLNLINKNGLDKVISNITSAYKEQFGIDADVLEVKASDGVHKIGS